jgi:Tol biopolymer transport system component
MVRVLKRWHRRAVRAGLALVIALLTVSACEGSGPPGSPSPTQRPSASGGTATAPPNYSFVLATPAGMLALDASGKVIGQVAALPKDSAPAYPSLTPNKRSLVFGITLIPTTASGFGSDVWAVDLDGSNLKKLIEHDKENLFYDTPLVDPSGQFLYVHRREAIVQNGQYVGNIDSIEKVDLATKRMTRVVDNAADPTLSPDGTLLVYVRYENAQPKGLWRVAADGSGNRPFFSIGDSWSYLQSPRFSPDGKLIAFSAAGHVQAAAPRAIVARGAASDVKLAHLGIPSELFLAPIDGKSVRSLGQTNDDTNPAWSPDGTKITYISGGALSILTVADGKVQQLQRGDNFFFGDLVWLKQ